MTSPLLSALTARGVSRSAICTRAISGHQAAAAAVVEAIRAEELRVAEDAELES